MVNDINLIPAEVAEDELRLLRDQGYTTQWFPEPPRAWRLAGEPLDRSVEEIGFAHNHTNAGVSYAVRHDLKAIFLWRRA